MDLIKGLKYIHDFGIVLSDISPAKILLDSFGTLKYSNFCLAKVQGENLGEFFAHVMSREEGDNRESATPQNIQNRTQGYHLALKHVTVPCYCVRLSTVLCSRGAEWREHKHRQ
ncbi:serine/threonine-protein kinase ULK4-like [Neoarius graeffei]|uniref:serine/threonine-protein kinase ULK4-like n=1 Tax=Neoarius graeffei TaxID=443677 RepID=UPI00298C5893|nr:serine/threonine-protein kinase ULK4-like [Neoarius graeffei]